MTLCVLSGKFPFTIMSIFYNYALDILDILTVWDRTFSHSLCWGCQSLTHAEVLVWVSWQGVMLISRLSGCNLNNPGITSLFVWLFALSRFAPPTTNSNTSPNCRPSVDMGQRWLTALQTSQRFPRRHPVGPTAAQLWFIRTQQS